MSLPRPADVIAHRDDAFVHDFEPFDDFLVVSQRTGGLRRVVVRFWADGKQTEVGADERPLPVGEERVLLLGRDEDLGVLVEREPAVDGELREEVGRVLEVPAEPGPRGHRLDARDLRDLGFNLVATRGTANYLRAHGIEAEIVFKVNEGRPHVGDEILNNHVQLVINTPLGRESFFDDRTVRRIAMMHGVPCITTLTGAAATVNAIKAMHSEGLIVRALQEYHAEIATGKA